MTKFYRIGYDSWERVDVLPPMGMRLPVGLPAASGTNIIINGGKNIRGTIVYLAREGKKVVYVGITNNFAVRKAVHLRQKGIHISPLMENLSRADARAVEQVLIEAYGLGSKAKRGTLLNRINSISDKNPIYGKALKRGYELLKPLGL